MAILNNGLKGQFIWSNHLWDIQDQKCCVFLRHPVCNRLQFFLTIHPFDNTSKWQYTEMTIHPHWVTPHEDGRIAEITHQSWEHYQQFKISFFMGHLNSRLKKLRRPTCVEIKTRKKLMNKCRIRINNSLDVPFFLACRYFSEKYEMIIIKLEFPFSAMQCCKLCWGTLWLMIRCNTWTFHI